MKKLLSIIVFSIAFGLLEAIVVFYLQHIAGRSILPVSSNDYSVLFDIKVIAFILPKQPFLKDATVTSVEMIREFSTIVMLLSFAYVAGNTLKQRIGAFLVSFALWDIFYYVFLIFLIGRPKSLFDLDIFFLIPIPWVGPVITPLIVSILFCIFGVNLYLSHNNKNETK